MKYEIRKAQPADYLLREMDYAKIDNVDRFHFMTDKALNVTNICDPFM
jgi:hypothetical protein